MKTFFTLITATLMVVTLSACTKTSSFVNPGMASAAVSPAQVQVLFSQPETSYVEIGMVTTQSGQSIFHDRSAEGVIERLREEAASIGADAIIVTDMAEGAWEHTGGGKTGFTRGKGQAVAIRYKD